MALRTRMSGFKVSVSRFAVVEFGFGAATELTASAAATAFLLFSVLASNLLLTYWGSRASPRTPAPVH